MDNPYAPPILVADAADLSLQQSDNYLNLPWPSVLLRGFLGSLCAGGCVLLYQVAQHWIGWPRSREFNPATILEAASFSSALLFMTLAFSLASRKEDARNIGFAILFGFCGFVVAVCWLYLLYVRDVSSVWILAVLPISQIVTVCTACSIHRISIRPLRLLFGCFVGVALWIGLAYLVVVLVAQPLSYPLDDYAGYTLLTMTWCWTVALQMPWMLNKHVPWRPEP